MSSRPVIGLTTSLAEGRQLIDLRYIDAVLAAGGLPRILPAVEDAALAAEALLGVHGLVIPGGPAIEQGLVGALPGDIGPTDPRRARSDRLYLRRFSGDRRPVLGICYGMQLINAERGGTIYADVQAVLEGAGAHSEMRGGTMHPIRIEADSHLAALLGGESMQANTYHIQAVASLGEGLRVSAMAEDGVIEAVETLDGNVLGVQFHPERQLEDFLPLFRHLVERAAERT